jgi:hypothetical protein
MIESFVDLTYRGIELARRVKLSAVTTRHGYLEVAMPMPVGTEVAITTDERVQFTAVVTDIHEQIGGATQAPGMRITPTLSADAQSWWTARAVESAAIVVEPEAPAPTLEPLPAAAPVIAAPVVAPVAAPVAAPVVAEPVAPSKPAPRRSAEILAQVEAESLAATHDVVDDGRRTVAMDAVDPALIEQLMNGTTTPADNDGDSGPAPSGSSQTKKKSKRKGR